MRLTILGEYGPYPAPGGSMNGYLVESGETALLLEAGSGALSQLLLHTRLERLSAVVLSHWHYDHMADLLPMSYALAFSEREELLPLYAPEPPAFARAFLAGAPYEYRPLEDTRVGEIGLRAFAGRHPLPSFGVRLSDGRATLAYTGDSNTCASLDALANRADLLLADAGLSGADWRENAPHLSPALCAELALRAGAKALVLTHIAPRYEREALLREAEAFPAARLAARGEVCEL